VIRVLSLGAGVQSTTVALMSAVGDLPKLDHAIFADTGWEPRAVYTHLDWLEPVLEEAGIKVHRVQAGDIRENFRNGQPVGTVAKQRTTYAPVYVVNGDGTLGLSNRSCTQKYKIAPIERRVAELIGKPHGARWPSEPVVETWMGISLDEIQRLRVSQRKAIVYRYPLVENRMTRSDCLLWLVRRAFPEAPRSACIGCPYRSNAEWRRLDPRDFADAVAVEKEMQTRLGTALRGTPYLHRSCKPLDQADLSTPEDHGQLNWLDGIAAGECEGMCGV
jgi:hypothetical protein